MTAEERIAKCFSDYADLLGRPVMRDDQLTERLVDAVRKAIADRDFQWWSALCMVDTIPTDPGAVQKYIIHEHEYHQKQAIKEEREACAVVADEFRMHNIAKHIRARGEQ